ncbi:helix-turn-helix transcriptional regulator [Rhodopseudomonas sp. P2A-2r]|uniref:helix-turn-helix transcriptional regulator n=1 Tax=unclassified Rhodopseudomonas TaxID=2638247 RepID=UPI0022342EB4|nr:PAS and helix-turn-helix domain-containing protein [Rhodopseudomonas sp. P2A-2r]UZE47886.1 helix-turn-helix transcriptional regulator [Rhodopseudomonas sp. P2A-2r]
MRPETLSDIIGAVYDCVLAPENWYRALPLISTFGESAASSIVIQGRSTVDAASVFEHGAEQSFLRLYFEKLVASRLPATHSTTLDNVGEVATMTVLAGEREPLNSDFYMKWVRPLGLRDVIGVLVLKSGRRVAWFSVTRSSVQSRFTEEDLQQMSLLSPHICRALLISDALDLRTIAASRLEQTVDHLSTAIFLTEDDGRISYMNSSAERILKAGGTLKSTNGRLMATDAGARDRLAHALAQSVVGKAPRFTGRHAVALPDEEGGGLIANVLPLRWRDGRNPLMPLPGTAAVFIQDPSDAAPPLTQAFATLYGLSAAEERVLEKIVRGQTPQEAADDLGIGFATVKTHLLKIFVKTNTGRQLELVHLFERLKPPVRARRE